MKANSYVNANGKEIIVCKGGWKISREKLEAKNTQFLADQKRSIEDRQKRRLAKIANAVANGDLEEADYLRCIYGM